MPPEYIALPAIAQFPPIDRVAKKKAESKLQKRGSG